MRAIALTLVLIASGVQAGELARCQRACSQHTRKSPHSKAVCASCLLESQGEWAAKLGKVSPFPRAAVQSALGDPEWRVRWGAVRAIAHRSGRSSREELAFLLVTGRGEDGLRSALTCAHVAGELGRSCTAFLGDVGPAELAAARLQELAPAVIRALEIELYDEERTFRREALTALCRFRGVSPAEAVISAMRARAPATDAIVAVTLAEIAGRDGPGAGNQLLAAVKQQHDRGPVDRLLAIYSGELDALVNELATADATRREEIAFRLGALAPLAGPALEGLLVDSEPKVRFAAATAFARGEGRSLLLEVRRRVDVRDPLAAAFVESLRFCLEPACRALLEGIARPRARPAPLRIAAIRALSLSGRGSDRLWAALIEEWSQPLRLELVRALSEMPRRPLALSGAMKALGDDDPRVLASAAKALGELGHRPGLDALVPLFTHADRQVRLAAVIAYGRLARRHPEARPLMDRLKHDPSHEVRVEAARALGRLGGALSAGALSEAARSDPHSAVRFIAGDSLRFLSGRR